MITLSNGSEFHVVDPVCTTSPQEFSEVVGAIMDPFPHFLSDTDRKWFRDVPSHEIDALFDSIDS
jgi:hypothetical protein